MNELITTESDTGSLSDEERQTYIGLYLLKKLDLKPEDGGIRFPVVLPSEYAPLDEYLQELAVADLIAIDQKTAAWKLTKQGIAYLGEVIDEAEALIDEFDDAEEDEMLEALDQRGLDPVRARFLWGWYEDEFDDLVLFQQRRGVKPVENLWAFYLTDKRFLDLIADEVRG